MTLLHHTLGLSETLQLGLSCSVGRQTAEKQVQILSGSYQFGLLAKAGAFAKHSMYD